jgi:hypothetical protein
MFSFYSQLIVLEIQPENGQVRMTSLITLSYKQQQNVSSICNHSDVMELLFSRIV